MRLVVTPDRRGYLRRRWVEPATVVRAAAAGLARRRHREDDAPRPRRRAAHRGRAQAPQPLPRAHRGGRHALPRRVAGAALRGERQGRQHPQLRRLRCGGRSSPSPPSATATASRHRRRPDRRRRSSCSWASASSACSPRRWRRCSSRSTPTPTRRRSSRATPTIGQQLAVISDRLADVERRLGATARRGRRDRRAPPTPRPTANGPGGARSGGIHLR